MSTDTAAKRIARAFTVNLIPGICLWVIAISICYSYYNIDAIEQTLARVADLKAQYGYLFAAVSTAIFGGLIPFIYFYLTRQTGRRPGAELLFYLLFWGIKGVEVDLFYRLQGYFFGTDTGLATVAMKTAVDQLFYAPLWAVPSIAIAYLYKNSDFKLNICLQQLDRLFFFQTIPAIVVSNLLVWLPAVTIIYMMPPDLQIPLFNLVQCFFALLLNILGRK